MAPRKKKQPVDVLDTLQPEEGLAVLHALLAAHPELQDEARRLATRSLVDLDRDAIARSLVADIDGIGLEDLAAHAARDVYGYKSAGEAAWEALGEAVEPFREDLRRLLSLGLEEAARAQCEGMLLGLHELFVEQLDHEVIRHAPDFLVDTADEVLDLWLSAPGRPRRLDEDLLHDQLYEWVKLVGRVEQRMKAKPRR